MPFAEEYLALAEDFYQLNEIGDISPLAKLDNLSRVSLGGNEISDLSPLAGLNNLEELTLRSNEISDLSPLAG